MRRLALALLILSACAGSSDTATNPESSTSTATTSTPTAPTTISDTSTTSVASTNTTAADRKTTTQPEVELPSFKLVAEEDVSFPGAVRISLRVAVESGTDADQLRALASSLAEEYRQSHEYQALTIFFYHYPELAFDTATLGRWEDAPFGDWGRADEVDRGDYSTHLPFDDLKDKDWSLLPSQEEVDLYLAYLATYDDMDTGDELPSDDDVLAAVAEEFGVSPEDAENAANAALDWIFDG